MKTAKRSLLLLVTLILTALVSVFLIVYAAKSTILQPYETNRYISQSELYEPMSIWISDVVAAEQSQLEHSLLGNEADRTVMVQAVAEALREVVQDALERYITPYWLELKGEELLENVWDYILEESTRLEPLKLDVFGEFLLEQWNQAANSVSLPNSLIDSVHSEIQSRFGSMELDIMQIYDLDSEDLVVLRNSYQQMLQLYDFLKVTIIAVFIIGLVIAFRPVSLLRWSGVTLVWLGLWSWLLLLAANLIPRLEPFLEERGAFAGETFLVQSGLQMVDTVVNTVRENMITGVIVLFIAGALLLIASYFPPLINLEERIRSRKETNKTSVFIRLVVIAVLICVILIYGYNLGVI